MVLGSGVCGGVNVVMLHWEDTHIHTHTGSMLACGNCYKVNRQNNCLLGLCKCSPMSVWCSFLEMHTILYVSAPGCVRT